MFSFKANCYGASEGSVPAPLSPQTLFPYLFYRPVKLSGFIQANYYGASEGSVSAPPSHYIQLFIYLFYRPVKLSGFIQANCYSASEGSISAPPLTTNICFFTCSIVQLSRGVSFKLTVTALVKGASPPPSHRRHCFLTGSIVQLS